MELESSENAYALVVQALSLIPKSHYFVFFSVLFLSFLYTFLDFHLLRDLFTSSPERLTYHPLFHDLLSNCPTLHSSYFATPWLSSPHFQTAFLNFHGRPPTFSYTRQLFYTSDGGTIALDWLMTSDVSGSAFRMNNAISKHDTTPIVVVVPGLTSDSSSSYLKHLAFNMAKSGRNVVVSNHRGLGGVSITSDCFYNAGWTEDIRVVLNHIHEEYPKAPLFAVGTSIGANILVKYLGEDGVNVPVAGAAAICSPWDLLIGDRFICRRLLQKFYDRVLTIGLKGYAQLHEPLYTRLANWEGIIKSRTIREYDNYATCLVGKFETVDTYYRRCSSASYVGNVSVPLLCISTLDDPVCTREAIPWDECRANKNIVLSTPRHGGHLAMFEGITASSLWWVRAVDEFLGALNSSPLMHVQNKIQKSCFSSSSSGPSIDQGPYVNVAEDGMVSAACNEQQKIAVAAEVTSSDFTEMHSNEMVSDTMSQATYAPIRRCLNEVTRHNKYSLWLLAYIAMTTSWPLLGWALRIVFGKKQTKR